MASDARGAVGDWLDRVTDGAMVNVCLTWAAGFGLFVASFSAAAAYPAPLFELEVRLVRRLAKVIKLLVLALELLALPLVYVSAFKENPAGSQDATIVARDLSWNFWYPRCVSQIVLHAFLGPHVKTHHALRWAYLAALVGFVALDSVAAVALQGVRTCVANRRCRNPDGYDSAGVDLLVARELLALVAETWLLLCLGYVMASLGFCRNRFDFRVLGKKYDRGAVLRAEMTRCGLLPVDDPQIHRPLFGLHSRAPGAGPSAPRAAANKVAPAPS